MRRERGNEEREEEEGSRASFEDVFGLFEEEGRREGGERVFMHWVSRNLKNNREGRGFI